MTKLTKELNSNIMPLIIFIGILGIGAILGLGEVNTDNMGWVICFFLGLVNVIWFRKLGLFYSKQVEGVPQLFHLPKKWDILFCQILALVAGSIFVIVSVLKLIP